MRRFVSKRISFFSDKRCLSNFRESATAVVISIDRLHRIGPICCLLFDRIGVRQPGIAASANSQHWVNETSNWVCSDTFLPIGNLSGCGSC